MTALASLEDIAAYLRVPVTPSDPPRIAWRRSESSLPVELFWDSARALVAIAAPLGIDTARFEPRMLALAIASVNVRLEVFGVEYDAEPVFVSHVFLDADGHVAPSAIDRLLLAVDECAAETATVVATLVPREGSR